MEYLCRVDDPWIVTKITLTSHLAKKKNYSDIIRVLSIIIFSFYHNLLAIAGTVAHFVSPISRISCSPENTDTTLAVSVC